MKGEGAELVDVRGKPDRDPRYHMVSFFYLVNVARDAKLVAGDDASTAAWYDLRKVVKDKDSFAFDHHSVLTDLIAKSEKYKHLL